MSKLLCLIVALATAVVATDSTSTAATTPTTLPHRKMFNFLYGSSDRDDIEVDVNANAQSSELGDTDEDSSEAPETLVFQPLNDVPLPIDHQQNAQNAPQMLIDADDTATNKDDVLTPSQREKVAASNGDKIANASPTSAREDDVVWVTRYSYESVTIPLPTETPVTETDIETVTQTTTEFDIITATVTLPAGATPTEDAFHQGYDQGYNDGHWNCVVNATDTSSSGEAAYAEGYVDGAHWAYREGYRDGAARRPFSLPEFATAVPATPTVAPQGYPTVPAYQPQPTYPYGYGYGGYGGGGYGGGGYGGYGGYGPPAQAPPQVQPSSPPVPANPPLPISYTTVSYFVPYGAQPGSYYGGYPPYEQVDAERTPEAVSAEAAAPTGPAAIESKA